MKLFGLLQKGTGSEKTGLSKTGQSGFSLQEVSQVLSFFPIGQRLQYFCEYHKAIKIDTIIVAYAINDHLIYSNNDIRLGEKAGQKIIFARVDGVDVEINYIHSVNILVPLITRTEVDFDKPGHGRTQQGTERDINDFKRGNSITLFIRNSSAKGIPHLDTLVKRSVVLQQGIYAKQSLVVLQPELDTFECVEIRRFKRIDTRIPGKIQIAKDKTWYECHLIDFSEKFVRLELDVSKFRVESFSIGMNVVLDIDTGSADRLLVVHGSVHRKRKHFIVLSFKSIMKNGRFQPVEILDELYIKSALLDHPETNRRQ